MFYKSGQLKRKYNVYTKKDHDYASFRFFNYEDTKDENDTQKTNNPKNVEKNDPKEQKTSSFSDIIAIGERVSIKSLKFNGFVIVCNDSNIDEDVIINNQAYIGPNCTIKKGSYIGAACYLEKEVTIGKYTNIRNENYFHEKANIGFTNDDQIQCVEIEFYLKKNQNTQIGSGNVFGKGCKVYRGSRIYFHNYIGNEVKLYYGTSVYMYNILMDNTIIENGKTLGIGNIISENTILKRNIVSYKYIKTENESDDVNYVKYNKMKFIMRIEKCYRDHTKNDERTYNSKFIKKNTNTNDVLEVLRLNKMTYINTVDIFLDKKLDKIGQIIKKIKKYDYEGIISQEKLRKAEDETSVTEKKFYKR